MYSITFLSCKSKVKALKIKFKTKFKNRTQGYSGRVFISDTWGLGLDHLYYKNKTITKN